MASACKLVTGLMRLSRPRALERLQLAYDSWSSLHEEWGFDCAGDVLFLHDEGVRNVG